MKNKTHQHVNYYTIFSLYLHSVENVLVKLGSRDFNLTILTFLQTWSIFPFKGFYFQDATKYNVEKKDILYKTEILYKIESSVLLAKRRVVLFCVDCALGWLCFKCGESIDVND